ncbi:RNA 3'-terminal phosphate cyclase [Natrialba sp. SSL1]|uniref:RNA 3'-terminal phosphate cyclase n=1 Tax=Natrialba sp. SSL1 TaxID=1869245 RepID=UPI0008F8EF97|nr:RNA 3'-terminal phosphate cyclase [Natrialba sp. SSL1]OIB58314.1 RNA 3'-terminal-phosphate cyclase [Natrialba sp. SSL1]
MTTLELDGEHAGGQFLRSALALSVLESRPIRIENIRGDRPTPGLGHQHLAVLETMAELTDAGVSGADHGAETVAFDPGASRLAGGEYAVDIGTAGSVTLLFDAVLPLATVLESPLSLTVTGGTDVAWSPPLDYTRYVKLPLLRRFGLTATIECERRGFYPDGGGRATLHLAPSEIEPLDAPSLVERPDVAGLRVYSTEAAALAEQDVAHRQAAGALSRLGLESVGAETPGTDSALAECEVVERIETTAASACPGSAIVLRLESEDGVPVAGCSALGERGVPAERVGEDAADAANQFADSEAAVDRHLADQILVFLALAGGRVRVPAVTDHVDSSCDLLESFGVPVERVGEGTEETVVIAVESGDEVGEVGGV